MSVICNHPRIDSSDMLPPGAEHTIVCVELVQQNGPQRTMRHSRRIQQSTTTSHLSTAHMCPASMQRPEAGEDLLAPATCAQRGPSNSTWHPNLTKPPAPRLASASAARLRQAECALACAGGVRAITKKSRCDNLENCFAITDGAVGAGGD